MSIRSTARAPSAPCSSALTQAPPTYPCTTDSGAGPHPRPHPRDGFLQHCSSTSHDPALSNIAPSPRRQPPPFLPRAPRLRGSLMQPSSTLRRAELGPQPRPSRPAGDRAPPTPVPRPISFISAGSRSPAPCAQGYQAHRHAKQASYHTVRVSSRVSPSTKRRCGCLPVSPRGWSFAGYQSWIQALTASLSSCVTTTTPHCLHLLLKSGLRALGHHAGAPSGKAVSGCAT